ncbi:putative aminophosphonate oxidoreductase [Silvimonas terrae]|uniref:Putative aminophosphonate oxidoreductase n=1 Tax=Silvimonas terrae TaxID=300266 RepID=A0A840R8T4_9NEIS|nr:FAD-dependent oxidoreductase [Silvimonas terrae]MBB5189745.1 putative aminophosphonate oxidoreductase [Silvimonas terrae]
MTAAANPALSRSALDSAPFRPFWLAQALAREPVRPMPPLQGDTTADVCIIGGGFTGLWTAIQLKQAQPQLDVMIIEKDVCGAGASGRNGGCLLTWSSKFFTLQRLYGEAEACRLVRASEDAVYQIASFCKAHGIEAELRLDGTLYTATNDAQKGVMSPVMQALAERGLSSWAQWDALEVQRHAGSAAHLEGWFSPAAGSVQPGLLVRGLARVARQMGVRIHENTPMQSLVEDFRPQVITAQGRVIAGKVVLAMNAWMASSFAQFSRSIAIVSSDMIITEPREYLLAHTGLDHGTAVMDSRTFVCYYRSTPDGRIMLGKGGNTFAMGGRMLPSFDAPSVYQGQLHKALRRMFPAWHDVPLAASWNGASDRSVTGLPFFGHLHDHPNIVYGFGYSGNGVGPSYMGGQILASLVRGEDNAWTRSGLVKGPLGFFPPEPVRYLGSLVVRDAIRRKEAAEDHGCKPRALDNWLAKFAAAAGKADKG